VTDSGDKQVTETEETKNENFGNCPSTAIGELDRARKAVSYIGCMSPVTIVALRGRKPLLLLALEASQRIVLCNLISISSNREGVGPVANVERKKWTCNFYRHHGVES